MAGNTQMNENERGIFNLHGITGMLIATVLLLSILVTMTVFSLNVQNKEANNYYKVNQDINAIKAISTENHKHYELVGNK